MAKKTAKFKVGDRVTVKGVGPGTVTELGQHDEHWHAAGHAQLYSVQLAPWEKVEIKDVVRYKGPNGELRDHESDTVCVPETDLESADGTVQSGRQGGGQGRKGAG